MSFVAIISGSPSEDSRTVRLAREVAVRLSAPGFATDVINVRDLPAVDLVQARGTSPPIAAALSLVERARGVVVCSPVYKAAYSGVLKTFLDLLPQAGLAGKVALPLMTGGTFAHVLALDYALRPVLAALGALHVVNGLFLLDKTLTSRPDGGLEIDADLRPRLDAVLADFAASVRRLPDPR